MTIPSFREPGVTAFALLRRAEGATIAQIMEATGWQQHTVWGFFAGLKKHQGIEVRVLARIRKVGPNKTGAKGSYSIYRIADAVPHTGCDEANACLAAAAPELLAAARDMLVVWEGVAHPALAYRDGSPAARLRAAIARAEGDDQ